MKTKTLFIGVAFMAILACAQEEILLPEKTETFSAQEISTARNSSAINTLKALPRPTTWVDCILFGGVVTNATFSPESGNFDELYMMPGFGFKDGTPLISESKPGDQDYNGGRWHLNLIKDGVNPAIYSSACSKEDLDLDDFISTEKYFECPLLPRKANN